MQMALYTEAIINNAIPDIKGKPGKAILHYLRFSDDPISSHEFSETDLDEHRKNIHLVADGIRSGTFKTNKSDYNCEKCDYKDFLCPAWEE